MGTPLGWHKRQALTLASQLPENTADALLVLEAAKELIETFLAGSAPEAVKAANVLAFGLKVN